MADGLRAVFFIALGGASLAACATGSGAGKTATQDSQRYTVFFRRDVVPVTRVVAAPTGTIWAALPQTFADLGLPGRRSAREGDLIYLTPSLKIHGRLYQGERNSAYLDCGHSAEAGLAADSYDVTFAMMVRLIPQDTARTMVQVSVDGLARHRTMIQLNSNLCNGTGRLETEFLQRLEAHIKPAAP